MRAARGNRVEPSLGPGVAAKQPGESEIRADQRSVHPDRLHGVLRATRVIAAGRPEGRGDEALIDPEEREQRQGEDPRDESHCSGAAHRETPLMRLLARRRKERNCTTPAVAADCRAVSTRSTAGKPPISWRTASRSLRFTLLRTTASPTLDDTVMPTRATSPVIPGPGCCGRPPRARQVAASGPST